MLTMGMIALLVTSLLISSRRPQASDSRIHILCSFLPVYVFAQNVVGDTPGVSVDLLLSPDMGCPHDYALRPADVVRINSARVVVLSGLGAEPFAEMVLARKAREQIITLSDDVQPIAAEPETEAEHGHEHHHESVNPHVWASPVQAARQVRELARKLANADPAHGATYKANGETYARRLEALGERMRTAAKAFQNRNIVTFHDAFAYLARDLDLCVVATMTVDPQGGVSAHQMAELTKTIGEKQAGALFYEQAYSLSDRVAQRLAEQTGVAAYPLNPFNYYEGKPDPESYERVMEQNLKVLERALEKRP